MGEFERLKLDNAARNRIVQQATACLQQFIYPGERILICLPEALFPQTRELAVKAVREAGGECALWDGDLRWKTLLKQAFFNRIRSVVAPPMLVLGLAKLSKVTGTPLFIRNVVPAGFACADWMEAGIRKGLDCDVFRCEALENIPVKGTGDPELLQTAQKLQQWNSILDCSLAKGPYGLEMEIICFPGEKQPRLPGCAKRVVRKWDPEQDCPLWWDPYQKNASQNAENH